MLIAGLFSNLAHLGDFLFNAIKRILLFIDAIAYSLVGYVYRLFNLLANFNPFDEDKYSEFVGRIYTLLGVVMLFILVYNLLQGVIDPDSAEKNDASPQKFLMNIAISIGLIAALPTIYDFVFGLQESILEQNVIPKIIFNETSYNEDNHSSVGYQMAMYAFSPFFQAYESYCTGQYATVLTSDHKARIKRDVAKLGGNTSAISQEVERVFGNPTKYKIDYCEMGIPPNSDSDEEELITIEPFEMPNLWLMKQYVMLYGDFYIFKNFSQQTFDYWLNYNLWEGTSSVTEMDDEDHPQRISYMFPISLAAACFLVYVLVSFCFDLGKRVVKLLFLQIIAPIPVICRAIPKARDIFDKWLKMTLSVYLEVYIRILSVFFGVYLIELIMGAELWSRFSSEGFFITGLAKAFIILGIIAFIKELPKFLGNLFSALNSEGMSLGIKDKLKAGGAFTLGAGAASLATGAIRNGVRAFGNKENWKNKEDRYTAGSIMRNLGRGIRSTVAGGVSGGVRGVRAGRNAGSFSEMLSASTEASNKTTEKRDDRVAAKKEHGGTIGALKYKASSTGQKVGAYFGVNDPKEKREENEKIARVQELNKELNDGIESEIMSAAAKGEKWTFGAKTHNTVELQRLNAEYEAALMTTDPEKREKAREDLEKYKKGFVDEIKEASFQSEAEYEKYMSTGDGASLSDKERAALDEAHRNAENLKTAVHRVDQTHFINSVNRAAAIEYIVNHDTTIVPAAEREFDTTMKAAVETEFDNVHKKAVEEAFNRSESTVRAKFDSASAKRNFETTQKVTVEAEFDTTMKATVETEFNRTEVEKVRAEFQRRREERGETAPFSTRDTEYLAFVEQKKAEYVEQKKVEYVGAKEAEYIKAEEDRYVDSERAKAVDKSKEAYVKDKREAHIKEAKQRAVAKKTQDVTTKELEAVYKASDFTKIDYKTIESGEAFYGKKDEKGNPIRVAAGDSIKAVGRQIIAQNQIKLDRIREKEEATKKD